jgi:hypothetical protein
MEIPTRVLYSKWELHGKPGNQDKNNAYLNYPEKVCDLLKLAMLLHRICLLNFDVVEIE